MVRMLSILKKCPKCQGTGVDAVNEGPGAETKPCENCGATGYRALAYYPPNIFHSYEILEALDPTEHDALTDTQKEGVRILLSCGRVDLNDGKAGKVRLWNWFGAESTTVANLTALLI